MKKKSRKERANEMFARGMVLAMIGMALCVAWSMWWMILAAAGLGMMVWGLWIEGN